MSETTAETLRAIRARHAEQPETLRLCLGDRLCIETSDDAPPVATMCIDDERHTAIAYAWACSRSDVFALLADNARLDDATRGALDDLARVRAELDEARAALDRAHAMVREYGPRCSHPDCDALAPLRCDDCEARFCDVHDDGRAGHDADVAAPMPHAVGPDDLMAGAAMRAAEASR